MSTTDPTDPTRPVSPAAPTDATAASTPGSPRTPDAADRLPTVEDADIREELLTALRGLAPLELYAVETTHPRLGIPTHYSIVPGLHFRERDRNQSLGLFVGRKLVEDADAETVLHGLKVLESC